MEKITKINRDEFEKLYLIEIPDRFYNDNKPVITINSLFWLNNDNKLMDCVYRLTNDSDVLKEYRFNHLNNTQLRSDFKEWLLQDWQNPCFI